MTDNMDKFSLTRLRDIGWKEWDPIRLMAGECWQETTFADEYDSYLIEAALRLRQGQSVAETAEFLFRMDRDYMAMRHPSRERAERTARAISDYVNSVLAEE